MFEKEAKEYSENKFFQYGMSRKDYQQCFQDGAFCGYNKANEWHKIADGDLPKVDNKIVLCVCGNGYIDGKRNYILKLLTRKEFPLFQPVYAWKEIVIPELKESE